MEGFALGLSLGMTIGICAGAAESSSGRKKLQKQLRKAVVDNKVSIHDENGELLTVEALFTRLNKNYKKA